MPKSSINRKKIYRPFGTPSPSEPTHLKEIDDVIIQITQAFCPNGHNLVRNRRKLFEGSPGISLWISNESNSGEIIISPFHGDHSRLGEIEYPQDTKMEISCPVCRARFPRLAKCTCKKKGELIMIYLTPELSDHNVVGICNVWGCHRSKVFDQAQLMAAYLQD